MILGAPLDSETSARISGWRRDDILDSLAKGQLTTITVSELEPGDLARGVNHSQIITGAPVRIRTLRHLGGGTYRVTYQIIGGGHAPGWRDLDGSRTVTIDPRSARANRPMPDRQAMRSALGVQRKASLK